MNRVSSARRRSASVLGVLVALVAATSLGSCSSPTDQANQALEDAGIEVDLGSGGRSVPSGFPSDEVPLPDLPLESGIGAAGGYVFRYTVTDARADVTAYSDKLVAAGFEIEREFDNLDAASGGNVGFEASDGTWKVTVSAFGPGEADGNYMGVLVDPA